MDSRNLVALILAVCVFTFVLLGLARPYFIDIVITDHKVADMWSDLIKVIIGGLIGYISHKGSDK